MATRKGADYAWWRPPAGWFDANNVTFVSRYLSWLPNGKVLSPAEFHALRADGRDVCFNWEFDAQDQKRGYKGGITDASEAVRQIYALGAADPYNVYFSADWDASYADYTAYIKPYLTACANVLSGPQYVGVYGSYNVVKWAMSDGVAGWGWQTFAWSGQYDSNGNYLYTKWFTGAQVRQTNIYPSFDFDYALTDNFGQYGWRPPLGAALPAPKPVPPPYYDDTQTGNI